MPDWLVVADAEQVSVNAGMTVFVDGLEVAVFRTVDGWHAVEGRCPHQGASLGNGQIHDGCVECPRHAWRFRLGTGEAVDRPGLSLAAVMVRESGGRLEIDRDSLPDRAVATDAAADDGIQRFLVRYGALGWVGRFGTVDGLSCQFRDRVVVRTGRGIELGEVLADPAAGDRTGNAQPTGEVLRVATAEEVREFTGRQRDTVSRLVTAATDVLRDASLPLDIVDGEVLFDGESAVLYFLGDSHPDAGPLVAGVARAQGLQRIELYPMVDPVPGGCGSGGCGDGGCGDGGGGCGS